MKDFKNAGNLTYHQLKKKGRIISDFVEAGWKFGRVLIKNDNIYMETRCPYLFNSLNKTVLKLTERNIHLNEKKFYDIREINRIENKYKKRAVNKIG